MNNSGYQRELYQTLDQWGSDPLQDFGLNALQLVTNYIKFVVTDDCAGRPDLIAYQQYHTTSLWWAILSYNGITDVRQLANGLEIRIPNQQQLILNLNQSNFKRDTNSSVI